MKDMIIVFAEKIHFRIFKHEMSSEMKAFLGNLGWSFAGGIFSAAVIMVINILAGRLMGPVDYGKYSLVVVISNYLFIPIFFGLDMASVMSIARAKDQEDRSKYITSSFIFVLASSFIVVVLAFIFQSQISKLFTTDHLLVRFSLLFTIFMVLKMIMDGYIRGIHEFKAQFLGRFLESLGIIAAFIVTFIVLKQSIYSSYVITLVFGSLLIIIFYSSKIKPYFGTFDPRKLFEQLSYGKLFILATTLGTIFLSLDKVIINKYIGPFELGLYGAYYTASITLVAQMAQMFNNVFFPAIAKNLNKSIFNKIEKLAYIGFVPIFVVITSLVFLVIKMYGSKYAVHVNYVLIFGLLGTIQIIQAIYNSVIINLSKDIYKKYLFKYNVLNALTVAAYGILIIEKNISIQSVAIVLLINYIILLFLQRKLIKANL